MLSSPGMGMGGGGGGGKISGRDFDTIIINVMNITNIIKRSIATKAPSKIS